MKGTRATLISLLEADPPDLQGALEILADIDERSLTPDAASLRLALLDGATRLENGDTKETVVAFLRATAKGYLGDLADIEIDFDIPDTLPQSPFEGLGMTRKNNPTLPGPDSALLEAMEHRDGLTARRIAGDTITEDDIERYQEKLIALGKALQPLMKLDDQES